MLVPKIPLGNSKTFSLFQSSFLIADKNSMLYVTRMNLNERFGCQYEQCSEILPVLIDSIHTRTQYDNVNEPHNNEWLIIQFLQLYQSL